MFRGCSDDVGDAVTGAAACAEPAGAGGPHPGHSADRTHQAQAGGPEGAVLEETAGTVGV